MKRILTGKVENMLEHSAKKEKNETILKNKNPPDVKNANRNEDYF